MISNRGKKLKIICSLVILLAIALMPLGGINDSCAQAAEPPERQEGPIAADSSDSLGDTGDITITLEAGQYEINQIDEYSVIEMEGFGSILNPGEPKLPSKTFLIGLPPGAEAVSVDMDDSDYMEIPGEYRIMPAPPMVSRQEDEKVKWEENEEIYSSENAYPSSPYEYVGMGQMRKYNFARVRFSPITYYPATNKLGLYRSITLRVKYEISQAVSQELLSDNVMNDVASQIIKNYSSVRSQYQPSAAPSPVSYDYVIITTGSLEGAVEPLVTWKTTIGYSVKVVTTSWIEAHYSGGDLQEKIRNFLSDKYAEWGIEYVLIVGSHSTIPMRRCYPDPYDHDPNSDSMTPTDYYYADLTGNWDSDGDGYFGEYGQDNADFYPEVWVGRIPVDNSATVTSICQKSVNFEQDSGAWKKKALLLGAITNYENEDHSGSLKTDGAALMEECWNDILSGKGYSRERMYEMAGSAPSTYACDHPLTNSNVLNPSYGWPSGYGIVNWAAHGGPTSASRLVWENEDGDGVPESDEMGWYDFISSSDASLLDDSKPAMVFSDACLTAYPGNANNLGKSLLERGAVAFVGATRPAWGTVGWQNEGDGGCDSIDYYFFYYLINQGQKCGDALYNSKRHYLDDFTGGPWTLWGWYHWQNMFDFCLYGEPSLGTASISPPQPDITVSPPSFNVTLAPNTTQNYTLTIGNDGDADLSYNISDRETTGGGGAARTESLPLESEASAPILEWEKTFDGAGYDDWANSVQQTSDGGYIIVGDTYYSCGPARLCRDVWLIKTDANGEEEWAKTFDGNEYLDDGYAVKQTSDGGYIIAGGTWHSEGGVIDGWLIKTDCNGGKEWDKTFGGPGWHAGWFNSVRQTSDGGYILAGSISPDPSNSWDADVWLIKTDSNGDEVWSKTFGNMYLTSPSGYSVDRGYSVWQTSDGGYIIAGQTDFYDSWNDVWLIKTDSDGVREWDKTFGGLYWDWGRSIQQTSDGGYIMAGLTQSCGEPWGDVWLIKTYANGNEEWSKTFGGENCDEAYSVQQTSDGGYIIAGYTQSYADWQDIWLIKTDGNGEKEWDETFGGKDRDWGNSVQETSGGGYIIAGRTEDYAANEDDVYLAKLKYGVGPGIDLEPVKIYHRPIGPGPGESVVFFAKIRNNGSEDAHNVEVKISGSDFGVGLTFNDIATKTIPCIPGYRTVTVSWHWIVDKEKWMHNTKVWVDYRDKIPEVEEGNNFLCEHQYWWQTESSVEATFKVGNPGDSTDTMHMVVREESIPEGWTVQLPNGQHSCDVILAPGEVQEVILQVDPGASPQESATIVVGCTIGGLTIPLQADILIPQPDLSLYKDENLGSPINVWWEPASRDTNIRATVYNKGSAGATDVGVDFEISQWGINREWTPVGSASISSIGARGSEVAAISIPQFPVFNVRVTTYLEEGTGEWYEWNNAGTKCIKSQDIQAGGSVDVVTPVGTNVGGTDVVNLEVDESSVPSGWNATLSDKSVLVGYGETKEVTLTISAPQEAQDTTIIVTGVNSAATLSLAEVKLNVTGAAKDCPWLDETPKSGSVEPDDPADSITVTINTTGLTEGDYSAEIVISNNDPDPEEKPTIVPVTLHISAEWDPWIYDTNDSGFIEISELLQAINDYIGGEITISQLLELINLYISHTHK